MRIAVLIDAENLPAACLAPALAAFRRLGEPVIRRLYGDFTAGRLGEWTQAIAGHGLLAVQTSPPGRARNATDIALVIDAMDLLHARAVEGFGLATSDGDFTRLAHRIREAGLPVHGAGLQATSALAAACTQWTPLGPAAPADPPVRAAPPVPAAGPPAAPPVSPETLAALERAWAAASAATPGSCDLAALGSSLRSANPGFDPKAHGHRKLRDLVHATGRFCLAARSPGGLTVTRRHG